MKCRYCHHEVRLPFLDLGTSPPSNSYLKKDELNQAEIFYPLRIRVCEACWLVQTQDFADRELMFNEDYAYFSSFSKTWLDHAEAYVSECIDRFGLGAQSLVIEVAANDGYLLQFFKKANIPCLGIEPTQSTAQAARLKGITILERFFGRGLVEELLVDGRQADLMVANNVLAHVPDINDFVSGFSQVLKAQGVATFEFPHLLKMVKGHQFDTAYHEHYSYLSLCSVTEIFENNGLTIFDVQEIPTHGGSLRVFAQRKDVNTFTKSRRVTDILQAEHNAGVKTKEFYQSFQSVAEKVKDDFIEFLISSKIKKKKVIAYGAAAKGNTLLNFAGIKPDLLPCVIDRNPHKVGKHLPGSRIPIVEESIIKSCKPDFVVILPWNIRQEVIEQLSYIREWGGSCVTAVPHLEVLK